MPPPPLPALLGFVLTSCAAQHVESWVNLAQSCRDYGAGGLSEVFFSRALVANPAHIPAFQLRALLYHGTGRPRLAIRDADAVLASMPSDPQLLFVSAMCLHALGKFTEAIARYDKLFARDDKHLGFCQREWAAFQRWVSVVLLGGAWCATVLILFLPLWVLALVCVTAGLTWTRLSTDTIVTPRCLAISRRRLASGSRRPT